MGFFINKAISPQALTLFLHSIIPLISLAFIGHVDKEKSELLIDATCKSVCICIVCYLYNFSASTGYYGK